jgi:hypothetical protein
MRIMLPRARAFILANARLLERRLFAFHFEAAPLAPALAALGAYQNADGGFGNALEPDKRTPASQPQDVEIAFEILDAANGFAAPAGRAMALAACDWLASISTPAGGTPYALASVNDAAHTPWWAVTDAAPPAALNPTAAIAGYLLKHGVDHPWLAPACAYCWDAIDATQTRQFHDLMPMIMFLQHAPDRARAAARLAHIAAAIAAPGVVETDSEAGGYAQKPLDWAPTPESFCRALFADDLIARHLDALRARQQEDGGWPISWTTVSPGAELEWRGVVTIKALRTLRAYRA